MGDQEALERAIELFHEAYRRQMKGELEEAVELYRRSIEALPTAEAHTFLGWTYSFMGDYDTAIKQCQRAIEIDPDFGNPYNDIGAYLIEKGQLDEAIPWLEKATCAARYDNPCFPHFNLGRVWEMKREYARALRAYRMALDLNPKYTLAEAALRRLKAQFN
jgi:tetratricopeptide (TPR) repeat protein